MPHGISRNLLAHPVRHVLIGHFIVTDHVVVRHGDFGKLLHQTFDGILLVRLPAAEIYIPHQHIANHLVVHFQHKRPARLLRRQHDMPPPVRTGFRIVMRTTETHCYFLSRVGPSPNFQLRFPLEHHAVAHQFGQPHRSRKHAALPHAKQQRQKHLLC